jgi:hypothetical protein
MTTLLRIEFEEKCFSTHWVRIRSDRKVFNKHEERNGDRK